MKGVPKGNLLSAKNTRLKARNDAHLHSSAPHALSSQYRLYPASWGRSKSVSAPLASAASPRALVSSGAFIASSSVKLEWERLSTVVILKLVAQPALTWLLATYVFELEPLLTAVAVSI